MRILAIIGSICLILTSCQKAEIEDARDELKGSWDWVQSSGGIGGWTLTPNSEGYSQRLEFTNKKVTKYRADTVQFDQSYSLSKDMSNITGEEELMINPGPGNIGSTLLLDGDTAYFLEECFDCFSHKYVRTK